MTNERKQTLPDGDVNPRDEYGVSPAAHAALAKAEGRDV